jgi:hypothetical protein
MAQQQTGTRRRTYETGMEDASDWATFGGHPEAPRRLRAIQQGQHQPLLDIRSQEDYERLITQKEQSLREAKHEKFGSMFVERVAHANGAVTLISWNRPTGDVLYVFDTYFRAVLVR